MRVLPPAGIEGNFRTKLDLIDREVAARCCPHIPATEHPQEHPTFRRLLTGPVKNSPLIWLHVDNADLPSTELRPVTQLIAFRRNEHCE